MFKLGIAAIILLTVALQVKTYRNTDINAAVDLIAKWEGFRGKAYKDSVGVLTIGYGYTENVKEGDVISKEKAIQHLLTNTVRYMDYVYKIEDKCNYNFTANQIVALTSFTYNVGPGNLRMLTDNCERDENAIGENLLLYNKAGGKVLKGLTNRRKEEQNIYFNR